MWETILQIGGTVLSMFAQSQQSQARQDAAGYNVNLAQKEAEYQGWRNNVELSRLADVKDRLVARQKVLYAKAGVQIEEGVAQSVYDDTIVQYEADKAILKQQGQFNIDRALAGGKIAEEQGESAQLLGYLGMGRTLLSNAGSIYDSWGK